MSPELLGPELFGLENTRSTKESDRRALGVVVCEVLSGRAPFTQDMHAVVIRKVMGGERPGRAQGTQAVLFTDDLYGVLELCCKRKPRPSKCQYLTSVSEGVIQPSRSPSPTPTLDGYAVTGDRDHQISTTPVRFQFHPKHLTDLQSSLWYGRPSGRAG